MHDICCHCYFPEICRYELPLRMKSCKKCNKYNKHTVALTAWRSVEMNAVRETVLNNVYTTGTNINLQCMN